MISQIDDSINKFKVLGISYKSSGIDIREKFAISDSAAELILDAAKAMGIDGMLILSTCNRTEIYTYSKVDICIEDLLLTYTNASQDILKNNIYNISGIDAIRHAYRVSAGLESQIVGDFQIVGQVKESYKLSSTHGMINTFMQRLFENTFLISKRVKNETEISKGASSVSHAAVQYIKENVELDSSNLLLLGVGQIGKDTCVNLIKHMSNRRLTLINRTLSRAASLAEKYDLIHHDITELGDKTKECDIIIVATGAEKPTLTREHIREEDGCKLILDLSVPRNVSKEIDDLPYVKVMTVDQLSEYIKKAMKQRYQFIPQAESIIESGIQEFIEWLQGSMLSPIIKAMKMGLDKIKENEINNYRDDLTPEELDKVTNITDSMMNKVSSAIINHLKDGQKKSKSPYHTLNILFKDRDKI